MTQDQRPLGQTPASTQAPDRASGRAGPPDRYAVIGNPIGHSKSPEIHARFALQTGQHLTYEKLLAPMDGFGTVLAAFIGDGARGANVTLPFKLEAYELADELSERASVAGAVNTLIFEDGRIRGDNTDGVGMVTDIVRNAGYSLTGKRVLLLGAGGAARGVLLPILAERPASMAIANRTRLRAEELARQVENRYPGIATSAFGQLQGEFDVVINATSASLAAEVPNVPPSVFTSGTLAYDMMYAARDTVFLQFAGRHGAVLRDGLGMLVEQAAESFFLWRGVRPETALVLQAMRNQLRQS